MAAPPFEEIAEIIEFRLNQVVELLNEIEYELNTCTPRELYDYLTGGTFRESNITFRDRVGNEYLFLHTIIEISALKDEEIEITPDTVMKTSKEKIYDAHLKATDYELGYSLILEDFYWLKHRLAMLGEDIKSDKNMPDAVKENAQEVYDSFLEYKDY